MLDGVEDRFANGRYSAEARDLLGTTGRAEGRQPREPRPGARERLSGPEPGRAQVSWSESYAPVRGSIASRIVGFVGRESFATWGSPGFPASLELG
jgi:hypothetical protein